MLGNSHDAEVDLRLGMIVSAIQETARVEHEESVRSAIEVEDLQDAA